MTASRPLRPAWLAVALLAAGGLGAVVGRSTAPEPTVEVQEVERVVYRDRVVTEVVREAARVEQRIVYRDRVTTSDGTVRESEVERTDTAAVQVEQVAQVAERAVTQDVERRVEVSTAQPDWRAGVLVGVPLRLSPGPVLVGGHIQRRLWGPLSVGAWTLVPTGPGAPAAAGVSLSLEW